MINMKKAAGSHQAANLKNQFNYTAFQEKGKKYLPPFGKRLFQRINSHYIPDNDVFIFVGCSEQCWSKSKIFFARNFDVLLYPGDRQPDEYCWPVQSRSVLAFLIDIFPYQMVRKLAYILLVVGATVVRVISRSGHMIKFTRRSCYE